MTVSSQNILYENLRFKNTAFRISTYSCDKIKQRYYNRKKFDDDFRLCDATKSSQFYR